MLAYRRPALAPGADACYSPNPFVRIGLFIFGWICAGAAQGLLFLMASPRGDEARAALIGFCGLACLGVQEVLARRPKPFFRAGLEEAMAYLGTGCVLAAVLMLIDFGRGHEAAIALIIAAGAALAAIRYADSLLAAVAMGAVLFAIFDAGKGLGPQAVLWLPLTLIVFSGAVVFASGWARRRPALSPWEHVFDLLRLLGLLVVFAGGNYLVVREVGGGLLGTGSKREIPFAFLFQAWTYCLPPLYLAHGLWRKDRQTLDAGLILVGAAVGTYKYYHSTMPLEAGLVLGGIALLLTAWAALKAFRPARYGITAAAGPDASRDGLLNAEGLALLHSAPTPEIPGKVPDAMEGGGGKFGGGGAQGGF